MEVVRSSKGSVKIISVFSNVTCLRCNTPPRRVLRRNNGIIRSEDDE